MSDDLQKPLTHHQRVWVEEYLRCWNGAEAARLAGYKRRADAVSSRNLAHPGIKAEINRRMKEIGMETDEVALRLTQQARVSIADFLHPDGHGGIVIDWDAVKANGHLVKSIKPTQNGIALELHDAQGALDKLARVRGMYKENLDVTSGNKPLKGYTLVSPDDWDAPTES